MATIPNRHQAWIRARQQGKRRCKSCGLYSCICQTKIGEYTEKPRPIFLKEQCPICGTYLCDCVRNPRGELI